MNSHRRVLKVLLVLACLLAAGACRAQLCVVVTTPVLFLDYKTVQTDGQGAIVVTCTLTLNPDITYQVNLGASANTQGTQRRMAFGASFLNYNLYCDNGYGQPWFDNLVPGTCNVSGTFPLIRTHNVYGRIPASQLSVEPGLYMDSVPVTVLY